MKKENKNVTEINSDYIKVAGTNYVILSDGKIARLLKPFKHNESIYYNLIINGEYKRIAADKVKDLNQNK